jgi:ATP-binding cassette subfamily F protein 3
LIQPLEGEFKAAEGVTLTYFAQDQLDSISLEDSVLSNLTQATGMSDREARNLLGAFLFGGDDVKKNARVLSGGELSRLGLARSVGKKCGLMLLDEPTNHLDMSSVEILADSLSNYTGSIVFVSHDRTFIDQVCTHVFAMLPDGRSMLFEGNLADYARQADLCGFPNVLSTEQEESRSQSSAPSDHSYVRSKEQKRQKEKAQRSLQACEAEQEKIRTAIGSIERELAATAPTDHAKLAELGKKLASVRQDLGEQEELWLTLAEELDS